MGRGPLSEQAGTITARSLLYGSHPSRHGDPDKKLRYLYPKHQEPAGYGDALFVKQEKISGSQGEFIFSQPINPDQSEDVLLPEAYLRRQLGLDHVLEAEQLVDQAVDIMGPEYRQVFPERRLSEVDGETGIAVDYHAGPSYQQEATAFGQYEARKKFDNLGIDTSNIKVLSQDERDQLHQLKRRFFYRPDQQPLISEQEWMRRARRILFTDEVLMNDFRSAESLVLTDQGPVSTFDGMALSYDREARLSPMIRAITSRRDSEKELATSGEQNDQERPDTFYYPEIINQTGGLDLLDEEREALKALQQSDFADQVEEKFGEEVAQVFRQRVATMLDSGKLPFDFNSERSDY